MDILIEKERCPKTNETMMSMIRESEMYDEEWGDSIINLLYVVESSGGETRGRSTMQIHLKEQKK